MHNKKRYSLKFILAISLIGLQFLAVSTIISFTFFSSERALLRQSSTLLDRTGENILGQVESFLAPAQMALQLTKKFSETQLINVFDDEELEKHLFQQILTSPQISGLYFAHNNGRFVYVMRTEDDLFRTKIIDPFEKGSRSHPARYVFRNDRFAVVSNEYQETDTYEARTRPWFQAASETRAAIWSDPYIFFSNQERGITYAVPLIAANGDVIGVFGVDISIDEISNFLSDLFPPSTGSTLILDNNGEVLAHPQLQLLDQLVDNDSLRSNPSLISVDQLNDPVAQAAFGDFDANPLTSKQQSLTELPFTSKRYVSLTLPVLDPGPKWYIGVYASEDSFIGEIKAERTRWIWMAVFVAAVTALLGLRLADWINKPLQRFASGTQKISEGDFSHLEDLQSPYAELEGTGKTFMKEIRGRQKFEAAYGRTFELTSRGMAQIDSNTGKFLRGNQQLLDLLQLNSETLKSLSLFDLVTANSSRPLNDFRRSLEEESEFISDIQVTLQNNSHAWLRVNAILILDEAGKPDHVLAIFDDVSEQKEAAQVTAQLRRDLSHLSRVNTMGEMASALAHELNQPLSAIAHNVDAVQFSLKESSPENEEALEICSDIERQALRAGSIIHALRNVVRKDKGNMREFDLVDLCHQTVDLMDVEARSHKCNIKIHTNDEVYVFGNRTQIAQVIVNLLRNAIDAILEKKNTNEDICLFVCVQDNQAKVVVEDHGVGVASPETLFQKFSTFKSDGMGLGLSISRSIIDAHEGEIWYEPAQGGGSRFCFSLPLKNFKVL